MIQCPANAYSTESDDALHVILGDRVKLRGK